MTHSRVGLILELLLWKLPRTAACYLLTDQRWPRTIQSEGLRGRGWRNGWRADSQVGSHCSCQKELCGDSRRGQRRRSLCQPHKRLQQRGRQARKEKQKRQQLLVLSPYFWILEYINLLQPFLTWEWFTPGLDSGGVSHLQPYAFKNSHQTLASLDWPWSSMICKISQDIF